MRSRLPRSLDLGFSWPSKKWFPFPSCWHLPGGIQSFPKEWRNVADKCLTTLCSYRQYPVLAAYSSLWHFEGRPLLLPGLGTFFSGTVDQRRWKKRNDVINSSWYLETKENYIF